MFTMINKMKINKVDHTQNEPHIIETTQQINLVVDLLMTQFVDFKRNFNFKVGYYRIHLTNAFNLLALICNRNQICNVKIANLSFLFK